MDGILLVDKAKGPTSHDVVARVRRALSQRSVGHAGTLDPMATGLLVIGLGEGTKLLAALTDDDKAYEARIELGTSTDTLDAEGTVTETAAVPTFDRATVERAVLDFVGTHLQVAPAYSAIKRDGRPLYELARRGEVVDAPTREVVLRTVAVGEISDRFIDIRMECGKGFYVRSFARDLAAALGTLGHLSALRRLASGGHRVNDALAYDDMLGEGARERVSARVRSLADGLGTVPSLTISERGLLDARHGRPVGIGDVPGAELLEDDRRVALLTHDRRLVALVRRDGDCLRIARGFVEGQRDTARVASPDDATPGTPCSE